MCIINFKLMFDKYCGRVMGQESRRVWESEGWRVGACYMRKKDEFLVQHVDCWLLMDGGITLLILDDNVFLFFWIWFGYNSIWFEVIGFDYPRFHQGLLWLRHFVAEESYRMMNVEDRLFVFWLLIVDCWSVWETL